MPHEWYCRIDDKEFGPLASNGLRSMVQNGQLKKRHYVRRGAEGDWVPATRLKGLFNDDDGDGSQHEEEEFSSIDRLPAASPADRTHRSSQIRSIADCVSKEEKKKRLGVMVLNGFLWLVIAIFVLSSMGFLLIAVGITWIVNRLLAEYNVRKLQALGTTATNSQFPQIFEALEAICDQFEIAEQPKVIILNDSSFNAFAVRFARKKVIVLLSQTLEGILDRPVELRFVLAHELCHLVLDHGFRGKFELYKPAAYRAARELTCDNCGCAAAGDLEGCKTLLKRLAVGNNLHPHVDEEFVIAESQYIYSGLSGWLLKQYLTHPPLGKRITNVAQFANENSST